MTPEQLVPCRETCERLMAEGWTAETYFVQAKTLREWSVVERWSLTEVLPEDLPAPTLAELLEELPVKYRIGKGGPDPDRDTFAIYDPDDDTFSRDCYHANAAEAAAKLWLSLRTEARS